MERFHNNSALKNGDIENKPREEQRDLPDIVFFELLAGVGGLVPVERGHREHARGTHRPLPQRAPDSAQSAHYIL